MTRSVGVALRRTAGGSAILAIGFGVLSMPHELAPVSAAASIVPATGASGVTDAMLHPPVPPTVTVYVEATPSPIPTAAATVSAAPLVVRPMARAIGPVTGAANGFAYGYCTWWVAHKRYVPWRGNAAQWWWNARPFGYAEGSAPRPGAIMVMGVSGSSPEGHVAYVESVNANGSFVVSEMNWWGVPGGGWGRVDYRTVASMSGILGFIY